MLRPYQQEAVDKALLWMKRTTDKAVIDAATGAGKSHIIAAIAEEIHKKTGKRILCLAPSSELVTQNRNKYLAAGYPASMFSASAGAKDTRHPVVFGSPMSVKNKINRFQISGSKGYALVIIDECHGVTPTIKIIVEEMKKFNPLLRVIGLTATPYRLGTGFIFREHENGKVNDDDACLDPYFQKCIFEIGAKHLIGEGYLTPPTIGEIGSQRYDTAFLETNKMGKFNAEDIDRAYHGQGRTTSDIVADVVEKSRNRKGVILFAATVRHAEEVIASLPPEISAIVTGSTPAKERAQILKMFLAKQIKYLVNVAVLTTGFDAPHVDLIALLRKTESVGLLQQIIGRGLRLSDDKDDCLILDYTTNIEQHCPTGDLFDPLIEAKPKTEGEGFLSAICPDCDYDNNFKIHKDATGYVKSGLVDSFGYCVDMLGNRIETDFGPMPAHYGRRCWGQVMLGAGTEYERCSYRWTFKECKRCSAENDISAKYCISCKCEIVDPNENLILDFRAKKKNPHEIQTDRIISMRERSGISRSGNETLRVDFITPHRSFSVWYMPKSNYPNQMKAFGKYKRVTSDGTEPITVTYQKDASGFFRILDFNLQEDQEPKAS